MEAKFDHDIDYPSLDLNGHVKYQLPQSKWQSRHNIVALDIKHRPSGHHILHSSQVSVNGDKAVSADFNYKKQRDGFSGDVDVTLPYLGQKSAKVCLNIRIFAVFWLRICSITNLLNTDKQQ